MDRKYIIDAADKSLSTFADTLNGFAKKMIEDGNGEACSKELFNTSLTFLRIHMEGALCITIGQLQDNIGFKDPKRTITEIVEKLIDGFYKDREQTVNHILQAHEEIKHL